MQESKKVLNINEVVAYNLTRARRRRGWTQDETASRLSAVTGKRWTKATLGAAERSWETSRIREFNANELIAFCRVFEQPLGYFFLPPDSGEGKSSFITAAAPEIAARYEDPRESEGDYLTNAIISDVDLFNYALSLFPGSEFVDEVNSALMKRNMIWYPSRPQWYIPMEGHDVGDLETEPEAMPSSEAAISEAKRSKVIEMLRQIERLIDPQSFPPF